MGIVALASGPAPTPPLFGPLPDPCTAAAVNMDPQHRLRAYNPRPRVDLATLLFFAHPLDRFHRRLVRNLIDIDTMRRAQVSKLSKRTIRFDVRMCLVHPCVQDIRSIYRYRHEGDESRWGKKRKSEIREKGKQNGGNPMGTNGKPEPMKIWSASQTQ